MMGYPPRAGANGGAVDEETVGLGRRIGRRFGGSGGSGGSGNTKGSGNSNQAFTGVNLGGAGGARPVGSRVTREPNKTADKAAKRPKKIGSVAKMDDAADCLQLLSERAV